MQRYVTWMDALATGDARAAGHAFALVPQLVPDRGLSDADNAAIATLRERVEAIKNSRPDAVRAALPDIGRDVVFLALRHEGGPTTLAEAWCPDAGSWLQRDLSKPVSPYGTRCARWR